VRETNNKLADAKLELFKLRDEREGGSKIIGTGPGGAITEADKIKAKAQAMLQDHVVRMTGKSINFGSDLPDSSASRRYEEEVIRVNTEKEIREQSVADIERTISRIQDSIMRIAREREEIEDKLRRIEGNTRSSDSDARKWEDGTSVGEEVRKFIDELKRDAPNLSYRTEYSQSNYSYDKVKYSEPRYSSTKNDTHDRNRSASSSSLGYSPVSSSVQSCSDAKTPEERSAFIQAEAKRRMEERLKALGIDKPSSEKPTSTPGSSTIADRLVRERADAAEKLERAEREAAERERIREQKLLAEKQKKAEQEADRLKKIEEFKRQEEERKNKWLIEARELEKAKEKKLRDKEEASRLMELELERRRLETEREKPQQEERLSPPPTVSFTAKSTTPKPSSNIPVAPPAPPSNIPVAPPMPPSSNVPSAPPLPPSSSNIPSAPPAPTSTSKIPSAPPLPPTSSNIPSAPPLPPSALNLSIASPTPVAASNTSVLSQSPPSDAKLQSSISSQPQPSGARSALLSQIQQGKKLKPTQTNDRSSPLAAGRTNSSPTLGVSSDGSVSSASRIGLGALFAGGMPKLQSRGGVETGRSFTEDTRTTTNSRQKTILKADRRISSDLFGSLASDQLANEGKLSALTTPDITQTTIIENKEYPRTTNESSSLVESPTTTSSSEIDVDFTQEFRVKSLYSYSGNGADDLSFEAGISFLAHPSKIQSNADWWYGVIEQTGAKGWFPKSYVEVVKEEKEICKAKVLYEWKAQSPDQLDIRQGNVISILDKSLGDWWKAEYEGAKGIIPSNYVEEISSYSDKDMTGEGETSNDDTSEDESNETNGDIRSKSDIVNDSKSDNIFDIVFTDPITIPKFSIQSPKNASFIKSPLDIDSRSASPNSSEPTEFVRSPSPTRLFGSSPIITVPWMQVGSFKRERNNSTDSNLNPQIMPQRPESPVSINQ
ncbi:17377_t:CDS:2, partial [Racocetra persica]